jgi:hypothetical protein
MRLTNATIYSMQLTTADTAIDRASGTLKGMIRRYVCTHYIMLRKCTKLTKVLLILLNFGASLTSQNHTRLCT